jgi:poly-gamma-glutamate synthesis protein (capsule biosynthesis protein)
MSEFSVSGNIAPDDPREIGKYFIDCGADLVLGNHPHWYQGVETYKDKLIVYAHGNFIFDQEWSEETTLGVVGKYTFYKEKLIDASFSPIKITDYNQPYFLGEDKSSVILSEMKENSFSD